MTIPVESIGPRRSRVNVERKKKKKKRRRGDGGIYRRGKNKNIPL